MLAKIKSFGLIGITGFMVDVEIDIDSGLPGVDIVGLPDAATKESKERVKGAVKNSGLAYPTKRIIANLAPADVKKEGALLDLPIAIGVLVATGQLSPKGLDDLAFVGELSLDGGLRPVKGILPIIIAAKSLGLKSVIIPSENASESAYVSGIDVYAMHSLGDVFAFLSGTKKAQPVEKNELFISGGFAATYDEDFKYIKGQFVAKRAMEIAAAGGHNILLIGPPGGGKTMMAKCLPSILPDMTAEEALETTMIHSVAGILDREAGIVTSRPFRTPHHTCTRIALTGGGNSARPGEISLAHNGVLFLDELPEYKRDTLEILRQPLEDNIITIARAAKTVEYLANFMLVSSMNPCPCGNFGSSLDNCRCTPANIIKYRSKLSGPLMDRIDLHIEVDNVTYDALSSKVEYEDSATIKARVDKARKIQTERFRGSGTHCNAKMNSVMLKEFCALDETAESIMKGAFERLGLSARAYSRILKVARTIADLEAAPSIKASHIAEAIQYRALDRSFY